jgi:hypothetical protein
MASQKSLRLQGVVFGVWLSWLYAFVADQANRMNLPGIPLPDPQGGFAGYYLGAILAGALIGLASTWPENSWVGAGLGGLVGAFLAFFAPWQQALGSTNQTVGVAVLTLTTFIPLALILAPISLLLRLSVNHLPTTSAGMLNPRRIGLPLAVSILAVLIPIWGMYSPDVKDAFYTSKSLLEEGLKASNPGQLPAPLQSVTGFIPNAAGRYSLEWSDSVERFMGPRPVTSRQNSDYLIIARFQNGFTLACLYAPGVKQPSCTNYK